MDTVMVVYIILCIRIFQLDPSLNSVNQILEESLS